jgi:multicomponent Na+:H+ antiporter subunit E
MYRQIALLTVFFIALCANVHTSIMVQAMIFTTLTVFILTGLGLKVEQPYTLSFKWLLYVIWLLKEIFVSALMMIKMILNPSKLVLKPVVGQVAAKRNTILFANSITLTPGTITTQLKGGELSVHAISRAHLTDLQASQMRPYVEQLDS